MAPIGSSLMSRMIRGGSSNSFQNTENTPAQTHSIVEGDIQMKGWMKKQKETLRSWGRRYFTLNGDKLCYYDSEDISRPPRGVLEIADIEPLTTENNGLILHLKCGKEVRLIADTLVAYKAWLSLISAAVKDSSPPKKDDTAKEGWAHCLTDEDEWMRYYVVVKNDTFSCYESECSDAELTLAGLVRSVTEWDGKRFGLILGLNKQRKIKLCFDSTEEKMTWLLTLELAASCGAAALKKQTSSINIDEPPSSNETCPTDKDEEDDGVWI